MTPPRFSIVIVAYGRRDVTHRCLDSLERCLGPALGGEVELVLVDNASPDDTLELFKAWRERATVLALRENRNFAGGCNAGAEAARGDVVVFLNNDTIVEPGMLEALVEQTAAPGVGAAGLRLLYLDGTIQHAGVAMIRVPGGLPVPHHLFHHQPGDLPAAQIGYELDVVTAACLAVRRDVFAQVGGYDTGFVNGWEDVDLCLRLRVAGQRIVYRGDLWLWHDEGRTRGTVRGADANAELFYRRWHSVLDSDEELIARVFAGRLPDRAPDPVTGPPARILVEGPVTGLSAAAAEARGILLACAAAGVPAAAREPIGEMVWAELDPVELQEIRAALSRPAAPDAIRVDPLTGAPGPYVPCGPAGPGGRGVLCLLPAHDLRSAHVTLAAARACGSTEIRLLPTARSLALLELLEAELPGAEILAPVSSETRLRELAELADAFVTVDPEDRLQRSILIAAGAGAATVAPLGGRADGLLGTLTASFARADASSVAEALVRALEVSRPRRDDLAARVCELSQPEVLLGRLAGPLAASAAQPT